MTAVAAPIVAQSPWEFHFHPDVWALVIALVVGYSAALRLLGPRHAPGRAPASTRRRVLFFSGVIALWAGADWPMHDISESYLFSAHMVQHMLFTFVAPPLLLLGLPPWLLRVVLRPARVMRAARLLTRPLIALLVFNGVIAVTHWPAIVDASLRSEPLHFAVHFVLVATALLMWWPVIAPLPETKTLSEPAKMLYLFMQSVLPTVPASFLTFANEPIYRFYASVPRVWQWLDVVTDQRIAGLIMKLGGGLLLWSVIAVLFFKWNAREEAADSAEELSWDDFERELQAWDLRKS
jgi:putative membrane protein